MCMGILKDQPQLEDDYWNLNIASKQFVGKDASGLKWFECNILCSHHKNVSRLAGELEINESQKYCEVHNFEFVTQTSPKFEGLKRDSSIWIEDDDNNKQRLTSIEKVEATTLTSDNSAAETTSPSKEKKSHHEGNHRDVAIKPLYFSSIVFHIVDGI
ncbi:11343_t:CDS:2, partial [Paraglomus occultum]